MTNRWIVIVAALAVSGCTDSFVCTDQLNSVIQVDVYDSLTNAVANGGSVITLDGNGLHDVVTLPDTVTTPWGYIWFENRVKAGTYSVQVAKPGYRLWTQSGIRVRADACHVTPFGRIVVRLQR